MKVRLKPDSINAFGANVVFQFHEGPIKTKRYKPLCVVIIGFNSMKVRLKPLTPKVEMTNYLGFNSMKVRLKRRAANAVSTRS